MNDHEIDRQIERYARQLILPEIGDEGQEALAQTRLLILGAGGLGVPILVNATAAGFGHITIIDDDKIERNNLNRQYIYHEGDMGEPKAKTAARFAQRLNPHCTIHPDLSRFTADRMDMVNHFDIIIDATDNAQTRHLANQAALLSQKPLIFVSAIRFEGQLSVFAPHLADDNNSPCYSCLFPASPDNSQAPNCATIGILGAVTSLMGSWAVIEAVKLATQSGTPLLGQLLLFDGLTGHCDKIITKKQADCPICQNQ